MLSLERDIIGIKAVNLMPRRSRRTREEIKYEILRILKVENGSSISYIMLKVRLNYYQAKTYLSELTRKEFVTERNSLYTLLDKGKEFINRYEALKTINKT